MALEPTRKAFVTTTLAGLAAGGATLSAAGADGLRDRSAALPDGFTHAPGEPPVLHPLKSVVGIVVAIDTATIQVDTGGEVEVVNLSAKPFIWRDGLVRPDAVGERIRRGDEVTLDGTADEEGAFIEIQHLWVRNS